MKTILAAITLVSYVSPELAMKMLILVVLMRVLSCLFWAAKHAMDYINWRNFEVVKNIIVSFFYPEVVEIDDAYYFGGNVYSDELMLVKM